MKRAGLFVLIALLFVVSAVQAEPPSTPVLVSPLGDTTTHAPQFQWTGDNAVSYKLIVFDSANTVIFKKKYLDAEVCSFGSCAVSPSLDGLTLYNGAYSWRIIAINGLDKAKSTVGAFTINYPGKATLVSPINNATVSNTPTLIWEEVVQADQYNVKVKMIDSTTVGLFSGWQSTSTVCSGATCSFTFANPLAAGAYKWFVQTRNSGMSGYKSKSNAGTFTVNP